MNAKMNAKLIAASATLVLALVLARILYAPRRGAPALPAPTATPTPSIGSATAGVAPTTPSPGYRLAGTVVGDAHYAIVVAPDGTNDLYHVGERVPGLGKLLEIHARSAIFLGAQGKFEMILLAEPTATARQPADPDDSGYLAEDEEDSYADQLDEPDDDAPESDGADPEFEDESGYGDENY